MAGEVREVKPQRGYQEAILASAADIAIGGGAAGAGKSWSLVYDPLRFADIPGFNAILFRRISGELQGGGSVWDESRGLYPMRGGAPRESPVLEWRFPSGARIAFSHLQYEKDVYGHQSKQYAAIYFDELCQFTELQFWYMVSRNRSTCGVRPYIRAGCNPDPDSFVRKLIAWWIDEKTGFVIPERCGMLRWFIRDADGVLHWADQKEDLLDRFPDIPADQPLSLTFIEGSLEENLELMRKDPGYRSRLLALPKVERARLLGRNWNVRPTAGTLFQKHYFEIVDALPAGIHRWVRFWDKAATEKTKDTDPAYTAGAKMGRDPETGYYYVADMTRFQESPFEVDRRMKAVASQDGKGCEIWLWQDPGSGGKNDVANTKRLLSGYNIRSEVANKDKVTYAMPLSAQAEAGNVKLLRGEWNADFLAEYEAFPDSKKKDQVDAGSGAFLVLTSRKSFGGATVPNPDAGYTGPHWSA